MNPNGAVAFFVVLVVLIVLTIVLIAVYWKPKSSSDCPRIGEDVQTGIITLSVSSTGATGASSQTGFFDILETTLKVEKCNNRLIGAVSAVTSVGAIDESASVNISSELASIEIQVLVDGVIILPDIVVFDSITHVFDTTMDPDVLIEQLIILQSANSFNFVARNISSGLHTIVVQARLTASTLGSPDISATAQAIIGKRTLVVTQGKVDCAPCVTTCSVSSVSVASCASVASVASVSSVAPCG